MRTILKAIPATVPPDGTVIQSKPIELDGSADAIVTIASESAVAREPNELTQLAMEETVEKLPRFATTAALKANVEN